MKPVAVVILALVICSSACSKSSSLPWQALSPSAPTPPLPAPPPPPQPAPPPPTPGGLIVFTDGGSGFSTSDVRDVDGQIVRFSTADELIWTIDGTRFPEFIADGNFVAYHHKSDRFLQVRFGTMDGERRAYLTWTDDRLRGAAPTLLDFWVDDRRDLKIAETGVPVPGS